MVAELRGAAVTAVKSVLFTLVSPKEGEVQLCVRMIEFELLGAGARPIDGVPHWLALVP